MRGQRLTGVKDALDVWTSLTLKYRGNRLVKMIKNHSFLFIALCKKCKPFLFRLAS